MAIITISLGKKYSPITVQIFHLLFNAIVFSNGYW